MQRNLQRTFSLILKRNISIRFQMTEETLFDSDGKRLYLTPNERQDFFVAAKEADRETRTFCHTLHITGCRISEALALTVERIDLNEQSVIFRTLKKREKIHYRSVPVPADYLDSLDMVHGIREAKQQGKNFALWDYSRTTAWRKVKEVMMLAGIDVILPHATAKGLRHAYGIHAIASQVPVTELQSLLGHAALNTTKIYLNVQGQEKRALVSRMWN